MLKDQLEDIQRSKKTLLHTNASLIRFISDEEADSLTLYNNLPSPTPFTTQKSLTFDRHTLSEREEKRFNLKFAPFLKSLITEMEKPNIDVLLEYLVRIYCIDTYNPNELIFILLPFKKYFEQLSVVAKNTKSPFAALKTYSINGISKILCKDFKLIRSLVEYFRNYGLLHGFLDRVLDEVIETLKASDLDCLSEMYEIMSLLIQQGKPEKSLEIYHRMRSYLSTPEFKTLLLTRFSADEVEPKVEKAHPSEYQAIFNNAGGRELLKDTARLCKYLEYLSKSNLVQREFSKTEYLVLSHIFRGCAIDMAEVAPDELLSLFREIEPKDQMLKFIVDNGLQTHFLSCFADEHKVHLINDSFDIAHFSPTNWKSLVQAIRSDILEANYPQILERCLTFHTFDPACFDELIDFNYAEIFKSYEPSSAYQTNLIRFADKFRADLSGIFIENALYDNPLVVSYLLTHAISFSDVQLAEITNSAKKCIQTGGSMVVVAELLSFIAKNFKRMPARDLILWIMDAGFQPAVVSVIDTFTEAQLGQLGPETLFRLLVDDARANAGVASARILSALYAMSQADRPEKFDLVERLLSSQNYDILVCMANSFDLSKILIPHPNTVDFVEKRHADILNRPELARHIVDHIDDSRYLNIAAHFVDTLIQFRMHPSWSTVKILLVEFLAEKSQAELMLGYILDHFSLFSADDADLFMKILSSGAELDISRIPTICSNEAAAVEMVHAYLTLCDVSAVLPVLPRIVPLLIKYKRESVVSLFDEYGNIMLPYAKNVLQDYPEIGYVLVKLEPRSVLKQLCQSFSERSMELVMKIFKSKTCSSASIFKSLSTAFKDSLGSVAMHEHVLELVWFLMRSRAALDASFDEAKRFVSDLLVTVYISDPTLIYRMGVFDSADGTTLAPAFADCAGLMAQNLFGEILEANSNTTRDLEFLCKFLEHEHLLLEDPLKTYGQVFDLRDELSPRFIALIIRDEDSILGDCVTDLLVRMKQSENTGYAIDVLSEIFTIVPEDTLLKDKIRPEILVLSEDKCPDIAMKALRLIEILQ